MSDAPRFRVVPAVGLVLVSLLLAGRCDAACGFSVPIVQVFETWFVPCYDFRPVGGFAALISDPSGVNTNGTDGVCESDAPATNGLGQQCSPGGGVPGDGRVVFEYDFGTASWFGSLGCPADTYPAQGGNPMIVQVVDNDGGSSLVRIGWDGAMGGYTLDFAFPYDEVTGTFSTLPCRRAAQQSVHIDNVTWGYDGYTIDLTVLLPVLESDCNPGTAGATIAQCPNGAADNPVVTRGHLFSRIAACGGGLSELRTASWSQSPVEPDAAGHATLTFPRPSSPGCLYIGTTYAYDGHEVPAIAGFRPVYQCVPEGACGDPSSQLRIDVNDASTVWWASESYYDSYNLYRGDLAVLRQTGVYTQDPATTPLAARSCDVADNVTNDHVALAPGQAAFYMVTGNTSYGEGSLGTNSAGQIRQSTHPCP